jgi:hypothetical protein
MATKNTPKSGSMKNRSPMADSGANFQRVGGLDGKESIGFIQDEEDLGFEGYMIKPSTIISIWKNSKVKVAMFNFLANYFKPRTSYEPERIEYNALNILADYQCYNLEFSKNEMNLSD